MGTYLNAKQFLGLAESHIVARVNLADLVGGDSFVRALTTDEKYELITAPNQRRVGSMRRHRDKSIQLDMSGAIEDATPRLIRRCVVTDSDGGDWLASEFERQGNPESILVASDKLVQMEKLWLDGFLAEQDYDPDRVGDTKRAEKAASQQVDSMVGGMPNPITNRYMAVIRDVSGLDEDGGDDDDLEERKKS